MNIKSGYNILRKNKKRNQHHPPIKSKSMMHKTVEDLIYIKLVPENWTGYDNPYVEVTVKKPFTDFQKKVLKHCLGEAILRFSAMTKTILKSEIKP
jgi:hypothetical protein